MSSYYASRYREHGDSARGMDWKDASSQYLRFELLAGRIDWSTVPEILDVGCGNGEFLAFCRQRGLQLSYRGLDICPEMVAACRRRFDEDAAVLGSTNDLLRWGLSADYVIASGTFNVKGQTPSVTWSRHVTRALAEMFAVSRVATLFNVTSTLATRRYRRLYYMDAGDVARLARQCGTNRFFVEHTAPLFELTAGLLR